MARRVHVEPSNVVESPVQMVKEEPKQEAPSTNLFDAFLCDEDGAQNLSEEVSEELKDVSDNLKRIVPYYFQCKERASELKESIDETGCTIKQYMSESGMTKFTVDGITANYIVKQKIDFNQDALLGYVKEHYPDLVVIKEVVDIDALEKRVYKGSIKASEIAGFQTIQEIPTLSVKKAKEGK